MSFPGVSFISDCDATSLLFSVDDSSLGSLSDESFSMTDVWLTDNLDTHDMSAEELLRVNER